jgi:hypothetical protein
VLLAERIITQVIASADPGTPVSLSNLCPIMPQPKNIVELNMDSDRPPTSGHTRNGAPAVAGAPSRENYAPAKPPAYQYCVVALELPVTDPAISGRSNTDWTAIRPGPSSVSQIDLACQRAELNQ